MTKFEVGDWVRMPGIPAAVEVLEISSCEDYEKFGCYPEIFRFKDPESGEDDWMHVDEAERVTA